MAGEVGTVWLAYAGWTAAPGVQNPTADRSGSRKGEFLLRPSFPMGAIVWVSKDGQVITDLIRTCLPL